MCLYRPNVSKIIHFILMCSGIVKIHPHFLFGICNDWSKACGSMCSKMFNGQNQTGKGQRAKTGISEAGQRRKQYQAEVGVTGTGSEFQGRAVRGQTQR